MEVNSNILLHHNDQEEKAGNPSRIIALLLFQSLENLTIPGLMRLVSSRNDRNVSFP